MKFENVVFAGFVATAVLGPGVAFAQGSSASASSFPNKQIRLVVPSAPGGGLDALARALGQKLSENLGQSVIVENRAGGGGILGTDIVAKSAPDGYTLLTAPLSHSIFPSMSIKVPFDAIQDFTPVTQLTAQAFVVSVPAALPAKTMAEFIALAKAKPGVLNYASSGNGSPSNIGMELLKTMAGINVVHVPYKGGNTGTMALVAGEVSIMLTSVGPTIPFLKAGKLRALGVTSLNRQSVLPDLPSVSEAGVPGYQLVNWYSIMAPAKTPTPVINKLHAEIVKAMSSAELKQRVSTDGSEFVGSTPEVFSQFVRAEVVKWAAVIKAANVKLN